MTCVAARRRKWLAGLLALFAGIAAIVTATYWNSQRPAPLLDGSTITVVPGIHLLGDLGPAAAYAIETSDGLVLIDTGLESDARPLKAALAKRGLDWQKVRRIFLTHVHGDHCGGAEHLREMTGATVCAGQADVPFLTAGAPREAFFSTMPMPHHSPHPTTVDVALSGGETIASGDVHIQVIGTPGHTPGSTCYLVEREGRRILFAGDVITRLGENPLGTYSAYLAPRYNGDAEAYLASLKILRALPVPDLVLPGHPNSSAAPQNPHLTRQQWEALLDEGILEMQQLVAHYAKDGRNFLDDRPRMLLPDLYYFGDFQGAAVYGFVASSKFFVVDAPGGPGLVDFLSSRQRELGLKPSNPTAVLLTACGDRETAGLQELLAHSQATVVASASGVAGIQEKSPAGTTVISADHLADHGWFPVTPLALQGRGVAPVAYVLPWAGKKVIFSGRMPAGLDQKSQEELLTELAVSKMYGQMYVASMRQLSNVEPELWLPAVPSNGQNANIYGRTWIEALEKNYQAALWLMQRR